MRVGGASGKTVSLSFSMPFLRPPNMIPSVDEEAIQDEFNLKQIDAPMPEAPWQKRCKNQTDYKDNLAECTTMQYFASSPTKSVPKRGAEAEANKFCISARILAARGNKNVSLVSESDIECPAEGCLHESCLEVGRPDSPANRSGSEAASDLDFQASASGSGLASDSLVNLQPVRAKVSVQKRGPKILPSHSISKQFDERSTPGRYDKVESDSVVITERSIKEPVGLDQHMLQGPQRKGRERRVSNLSFDVDAIGAELGGVKTPAAVGRQAPFGEGAGKQ